MNLPIDTSGAVFLNCLDVRAEVDHAFIRIKIRKTSSLLCCAKSDEIFHGCASDTFFRLFSGDKERAKIHDVIFYQGQFLCSSQCD